MAFHVPPKKKGGQKAYFKIFLENNHSWATSSNRLVKKKEKVRTSFFQK